jgi:hypothetical protein
LLAELLTASLIATLTVSLIATLNASLTASLIASLKIRIAKLHGYVVEQQCR